MQMKKKLEHAQAPPVKGAKDTFKRYYDFRSVKVNSDRIDFDLKCEDVELMIANNDIFFD